MAEPGDISDRQGQPHHDEQIDLDRELKA
jgi:hypothetical protein